MKYYPVKIVHIFAVQYQRLKSGQTAVQRTDGIPSTSRGGTFGYTGVERNYWQVRTNLLGDCGHKHKTEASAKPCFRRMSEAWSALRSKQSKRAHRARVRRTKTKDAALVRA